jgi:hypothetical protein
VLEQAENAPALAAEELIEVQALLTHEGNELRQADPGKGSAQGRVACAEVTLDDVQGGVEARCWDFFAQDDGGAEVVPGADLAVEE